MASSKMGQCLICLPDIAGEYHVAFINVYPFCLLY